MLVLLFTLTLMRITLIFIGFWAVAVIVAVGVIVVAVVIVVVVIFAAATAAVDGVVVVVVVVVVVFVVAGAFLLHAYLVIKPLSGLRHALIHGPYTPQAHTICTYAVQ